MTWSAGVLIHISGFSILTDRNDDATFHMILLFILILLVALFLAIATIILLIVGPTLLMQPRRRHADFYRSLGLPTTPQDVHLRHEELTLTGDGGIRLKGWLVRQNTKALGTIIYLHGVADCKIDGIRLTKLLHDHGYHVLLYDSRRHGESEGSYCTYGFYEKHDVPKVIDVLHAIPGFTCGPIGLFGTSMGAAIGIQAAAIDDRIKAVVAENSFATLRSIFDDYQKRMIKLPFHYLRNFVIKRSEFIATFRANEVSPLDLVPSIQVPILFIYGSEDPLIKPEYTRQLFERKREPKFLYGIDGAAHNNTWAVAGKEYEKRVLSFFDAYVI